MTYSILIRPKATADFRAAAHWYESQRKGQGAKFLASVNEAIDRLRATPNMHQIVVDDIRRKLLRTFPYFLYYQVEERRVVVIGLFHTSRDPQSWQDRVEEEKQSDQE
jgi:toxin ParE1/3/4